MWSSSFLTTSADLQRKAMNAIDTRAIRTPDLDAKDPVKTIKLCLVMALSGGIFSLNLGPCGCPLFFFMEEGNTFSYTYTALVVLGAFNLFFPLSLALPCLGHQEPWYHPFLAV